MDREAEKIATSGIVQMRENGSFEPIFSRDVQRRAPELVSRVVITAVKDQFLSKGYISRSSLSTNLFQEDLSFRTINLSANLSPARTVSRQTCLQDELSYFHHVPSSGRLSYRDAVGMVVLSGKMQRRSTTGIGNLLYPTLTGVPRRQVAITACKWIRCDTALVYPFAQYWEVLLTLATSQPPISTDLQETII